MAATAKPAKVIDPAKAGKFSFEIMAYFDVIGGNVMDTKYAKELLTIDPFAELEDDCLIVWQLLGGTTPYLARWSKTGKDENGRFVRPGADNEAFRVGCISYTRADIGRSVNVLGRVVGEPREFPRETPVSYTSLPARTARAALARCLTVAGFFYVLPFTLNRMASATLATAIAPNGSDNGEPSQKRLPATRPKQMALHQKNPFGSENGGKPLKNLRILLLLSGLTVAGFRLPVPARVL
ncbi:hypothetical protein ACN2CC_20815 [Mesorhizobium muleiense]|uniref:hypothetical protein n=1 Tax=Mesorhizobium muleiense TaxID=1004279 RepID=UPI003AFA6ACE